MNKNHITITKKDKIYGVLTGLFGLFMLFIIINFITRVFLIAPTNGNTWSYEKVHVLEAFTNISNELFCLWCLLFSFTCFFPKFSKLKKFLTNIVVNTAILTNLMFTFLSVIFYLNKVYKGEWWSALMSSEAFVTHLISPVVCILFFCFIPSSAYKHNWKNNFYVCIFPVIYSTVVVILGYSINDDYFPYSFLNPNKFGSGAKGILIFIPVIIVLFAAFYGLGYSIARFKNFLHSNNSIVN